MDSIFRDLNLNNPSNNLKTLGNQKLTPYNECCFGQQCEHIMTRRSDSNVPFDDLCSLLTRLGLERRVRGDHHIFTMEGVEEIINIQPKTGMCKAYQVKQIRDLLLKYKLRMED